MYSATGSTSTASDSAQLLQRQILTAIRRIVRAVELHSQSLMQSHGLTAPQLIVLEHVAKNRVVGASDLGRILLVSQPTVAGILERLESRGLIDRRRNGDDRRARDISITEAGMALLNTSPPLLQERFCAALSQLEPWEQTMLLANLQRVGAMMDSDALEASPVLAGGVNL